MLCSQKQLLDWDQQLILHKVSNKYQTHSLELYLASNLELKELSVFSLFWETQWCPLLED